MKLYIHSQFQATVTTMQTVCAKGTKMKDKYLAEHSLVRKIKDNNKTNSVMFNYKSTNCHGTCPERLSNI